MKYLKKFENIEYKIGLFSGLFNITDNKCNIELFKEDLSILLKILKDKKINYYETNHMIIYLYKNKLYLIDSISDVEIVIDQLDFSNLISNISNNIINVSPAREYLYQYKSFTDNKKDTFFEELELKKKSEIYNI